ncbi:glycosyltransferase family 9 protein, partial [Kaarinaea lacus]
EQIAARLGDTTHAVYQSTEGLKRFAQHIQFADVFVSGSTGPLHIAGALNTPTAAFYPRRRSATSLRWQTLNSEDKRLAFSPPDSADEHDMCAIDITHAASEISSNFL